MQAVLVQIVMFISNDSDCLYKNLYLYLYLHMGGRGYKDQMLPRIYHPSLLCKLHYCQFCQYGNTSEILIGMGEEEGPVLQVEESL